MENLTNLEHRDEAKENDEEDLSQSMEYKLVVPVFILASFATFLLNVFIISSYPLIKNLSRVTKPYVTFILSLLISDSFTALLLGIQLLFGAYLPVVHKIHLHGCIMTVSEAFKLAGVLVTVYHLLVMVTMHLLGVTAPISFKKVMTQRLARSLVIFLWLLPFGLILVTFSAFPKQGFLSENCEGHEFLMRLPFRAAYSIMILIPTVLILMIYGYFHMLLWYKRDVSKNTVSKQNIRAAKTTLLIMCTCTCGWLPAVINHLAICLENCSFKYEDVSKDTLFVLHSVSYVLIILKSTSNPLIFAMRQQNIKMALAKLCYRIRHCGRDPPMGITNGTKKLSKYSFRATTSTTSNVKDIEKFSLLQDKTIEPKNKKDAEKY